MKILLTAFSFCVWPLVACYPVHAALVEADLYAPSDALITVDSGTNLGWLDVTQTFGFSFDEILSGVGNSWYSDGWRYATTNEIVGFMQTNYGVSVGCDGCPSSASVPLATSVELIALFGSNSDGWINAYFDDGPVSEHVGQFAVVLDPPNFPSNVFIEAPNGIARYVRNPGLGSLLVKEVSPVPIPATAWLFASALGLFGYLGKRRAPA